MSRLNVLIVERKGVKIAVPVGSLPVERKRTVRPSPPPVGLRVGHMAKSRHENRGVLIDRTPRTGYVTH